MRLELLVLTVLFAGIFQSSFGQKEQEKNRAASDSFQIYYNGNNYSAIYHLFTVEMKEALPLDKTNAFLSGLKAQAGKIVQREFERYEQSYASYKTTFENALMSLNIAVDNSGKINGFLVNPYKPVSNIPKPERNLTKLILPFNEEWTVVWGGDTKELNYHVEHEAQKNAFDLIITNEAGKSYKTNGTRNEDYYAFGKDLIAPCNGEVVLVVDGIKDNIPGKMNPNYIPGNTVIIKTDNNEFLFFAHFKQHSIVVKQGQKVRTGQLLGQCGNSGNSSEAHLHFHIQNTEDMNTATGIKCFFDQILVNGSKVTDYSPVKKDRVKNPD